MVATQTAAGRWSAVRFHAARSWSYFREPGSEIEGATTWLAPVASDAVVVMTRASRRAASVTNDVMWVKSIARAGDLLHPRAMQLIRIDHVSLDVPDRRASIVWYEQVLGLRAHARHDVPEEPVFVGPPGARLGLFAERPPGLRHVALATDPAGQRRVAARLDRLGIAYTPERHRDSDSIYLRDLDGTVLEVMVPRP